MKKTKWRTPISSDREAQIPRRDPAGLGENDHDLLTFEVAGERLQAEIAGAEERVSALSAAGDHDALAQARERLAALHQAARRIDEYRFDEARFERFFGYQARRGGGPG